MSTEEIDSLRSAVQALMKTVEDQGKTIADQAALINANQGGADDQARPPPQVIVKFPPQTKLGTFTGLAPKGGQEVTFKEWKERVQSFLLETSDREDAYRRVRSSLKGLSLSQVSKCRTADEILIELNKLYGSIASAEDQYLEFTRMRPTNSETLSSFFVRLWDKFVDLNAESMYSEGETQKKIYHGFVTAIKDRHPLLALELRNSFGNPGSVNPDMSAVLHKIRQIEGDSVAQSSVGQASVEIDYEKLSDMVAKKLQIPSATPTPTTPLTHALPAQTVQNPQPAQYPPQPTQYPPQPAQYPGPPQTPYHPQYPYRGPRFQQPPSNTRRAPKGPCFRCGEVNSHMQRDCKNRPNPKKVQEEMEKFLNY